MIEVRKLTLDERLVAIRSIVPTGFTYPERYFTSIASDAPPEVEPWAWLSIYDEDLDFWARIVADQFPERSLVPFAKHGDTDDVFCFEGTDHTGNPPVLIIHTFTTPGWEYRGQWASFDDWWAEMEAQHADWLAEREDQD